VGLRKRPNNLSQYQLQLREPWCRTLISSLKILDGGQETHLILVDTVNKERPPPPSDVVDRILDGLDSGRFNDVESERVVLF